MDAFHILGADTRYHANDPYLNDALPAFTGGTNLDAVRTFRTRRKYFDLCFEDSWSGYFVAENCQRDGIPDEMILIHLDDHTDMMSTLLDRSTGRLVDPTTNTQFDPASTDSWKAAIESGGIGIGSFVTGLFQADFPLHVRHLNNFSNSNHRMYDVVHGSNRHSLIPGREFATIRKRTSSSSGSAGSYLGGQNAECVLANLPDGRVIVHVDLDYFINDFNGNSGVAAALPDPQLTADATRKLDRFFESIRPVAPRIEQWIVATSPGFCSAYHWSWLLGQLEDRIAALEHGTETTVTGLLD